MHRMDGDAEFDGRAHGVDADQVATVDDRFCASRLCFGYSRRKWVGAIMAVGNDADFHIFFVIAL
jgi:hypothetical protein